MKTLKVFSIILGAALQYAAMAVNFQYSANYEIELVTGQEPSKIRTRASFDKGQAIVHELGKHRVVMKVNEQSPTEFVLEIVVTPLDDKFNVMEQKFPGSYGSILEFDAQNLDVVISGAIIVGSFKTD